MHPAHPLGVALRQVVVDGDDVNSLAPQSIQVGGQHRRQGLALPCHHLGDVAEVQCHSTHHLLVERPLGQHSRRRLAGDGERFGQQGVEAFPRGHPLPEFVGPAL